MFLLFGRRSRPEARLLARSSKPGGPGCNRLAGGLGNRSTLASAMFGVRSIGRSVDLDT